MNEFVIRNYVMVGRDIQLTQYSLVLLHYLLFLALDVPNVGLRRWVRSPPSECTVTYPHCDSPDSSLTQATSHVMLLIGSFSYPLSHMIPLCRVWIVCRHILLGIRIDSLENNFIKSGYLQVTWSGFLYTTVYLLANLLNSLLSIITDLNNTIQILYLLQVDMMSQLTSCIQPSDNSFYLLLWISAWLTKKTLIQEWNPTSYFNSLTSYISFVPHSLIHTWLSESVWSRFPVKLYYNRLQA